MIVERDLVRWRWSARRSGAPVDIAVPKEGIFADAVRRRPGEGRRRSPSWPPRFINEMLGPEVQAKLAEPSPSRCRPTRTRRCRAGMPTERRRSHSVDWKFVADNRADWVKRWDRDMAM